MKQFHAWLHQNYPNYRANDLSELKIQWLEETVHELITELAALKPDAPVETTEEMAVGHGSVKWPASPLVCHCETFEGTDWECERCGGGRF